MELKKSNDGVSAVGACDTMHHTSSSSLQYPTAKRRLTCRQRRDAVVTLRTPPPHATAGRWAVSPRPQAGRRAALPRPQAGRRAAPPSAAGGTPSLHFSGLHSMRACRDFAVMPWTKKLPWNRFHGSFWEIGRGERI